MGLLDKIGNMFGGANNAVNQVANIKRQAETLTDKVKVDKPMSEPKTIENTQCQECSCGQCCKDLGKDKCECKNDSCRCPDCRSFGI